MHEIMTTMKPRERRRMRPRRLRRETWMVQRERMGRRTMITSRAMDWLLERWNVSFIVRTCLNFVSLCRFTNVYEIYKIRREERERERTYK